MQRVFMIYHIHTHSVLDKMLPLDLKASGCNVSNTICKKETAVWLHNAFLGISTIFETFYTD